MPKFALDKIEKVMGKEENAGNQHFLLFLQCFQTAIFFTVVKSLDCLGKGSVIILLAKNLVS